MINNQEQDMYTTSSNGTKVTLASTNATIFLNSCERIGIQPSDFAIIIRSIAHHIIRGMSENESVNKLKKIGTQPTQVCLSTFLHN
jgi:hypothetical protein